MRTENRRTLVVFDEIHHGGDAKSWGDAIREAFDDATRRLALTGTPFRSDDSAIPFVTYAPDGDGLMRSQADHTYGYAEALADGVVRPVVFLAYSGEARWRTSAGEEHAARLGEPLNAEQTARAWRTVLDAKGEWIPAVLQAADTRLTQLRNGGVPDAGAMVIASDQKAARAYAAVLTRLTGETPTVVLSDDPGSSARIADFSAGTGRWLVAVRMVSEGVDVPRLAVGVYATSASTPLFFAQAIGRYVRSRQPGETASIFLPSVPTLLDLASQMEAQRDHVLGKPHRESQGFDDEALEDAARRSRADEDDGFESLGADAELDQVIFDGSSFGTATPAGSDEEADYLGIPGLLDADAMRDLLRRRQEEQITEAHGYRARCRGCRRTGSCANCAASSTRSSRSPTTAPASRTAGSTTSCAGSAAARRSPPRRSDQLKARIEAVREPADLTRLGQLGQMLQRVVQMRRVERRELDVLAHVRRHTRPVVGQRDFGAVVADGLEVVAPDPAAEFELGVVGLRLPRSPGFCPGCHAMARGGSNTSTRFAIS